MAVTKHWQRQINEGFIWALGWRVQFVMAGAGFTLYHCQEAETDDDCCPADFLCFYSFRMGAHGMVQPTFRLGLATSLAQPWSSFRPSQKVAPTRWFKIPLELTANINHHESKCSMIRDQRKTSFFSLFFYFAFRAWALTFAFVKGILLVMGPALPILQVCAWEILINPFLPPHCNA